jgi:hypothetical protein
MNDTVSEDVKLDEAGLVEAVADELVAHGEFSSIPGNNHANASRAARAILPIIRAYLAATKPPLAGEVTDDRLRSMIDAAKSYIGANGYDPDPEDVIDICTELLVRRASPPMPGRGEGFDLAVIEATVRKVNPGRTEDHIKSVALDTLSVLRALASRPKEDTSDEYPDGYRSPLASERKDR